MVLPLSLAALAVLSAAGGGRLLAAAQSVITDDTSFYGMSPPVYPSRESTRYLSRGGAP